ncbi:MAG: hypothetical protein ACYDGY_10950 [Acidimicrobiales bacterium]
MSDQTYSGQSERGECASSFLPELEYFKTHKREVSLQWRDQSLAEHGKALADLLELATLLPAGKRPKMDLPDFLRPLVNR